MTCEWCGEYISRGDSQTATGSAHWHTRCANEVAERRQEYLDEMDNLEGFSLSHAPPDPFGPALPDEPGPKPKWSEVFNEMATANTNRPPREVVDFPLNTPVTVALKYPQGRIINGQYGERVMYTLTDGSVMFLAPEIAGKSRSSASTCANPLPSRGTRPGKAHRRRGKSRESQGSNPMGLSFWKRQPLRFPNHRASLLQLTLALRARHPPVWWTKRMLS